jgi:hypothetical protein
MERTRERDNKYQVLADGRWQWIKRLQAENEPLREQVQRLEQSIRELERALKEQR